MQPVAILTRRSITKAAEAVKEKSCTGVLEGFKKFIGGEGGSLGMEYCNTLLRWSKD